MVSLILWINYFIKHNLILLPNIPNIRKSSVPNHLNCVEKCTIITELVNYMFNECLYLNNFIRECQDIRKNNFFLILLKQKKIFTRKYFILIELVVMNGKIRTVLVEIKIYLRDFTASYNAIMDIVKY